MNKTAKIIIALVVVAVIAAAAVLLTSNKANEGGSETNGTDAPQPVQTITYDGTSFNPQHVTVAVGGTLTMVNQSDSTMEPSSGPHPTHTTNPELNFGDIEAGQSKTLTLTSKGKWSYHNHYNEDHGGTVTVE